MSPNKSIHELLEKGLYYYGLGEIEKAIERWKEVLVLDPGNETAREYIEIETGHKLDASPESEPVEDLPEEAIEDLPVISLPASFIEGQRHLQNDDWLSAIAAFETSHKQDPDNPMHWAHVELARARLIKEVIDRSGHDQLLRLAVPITQLVGQKNITQEEGFVLSLLSSETTLADVVALSPLPHFQTYRIVYRLYSQDLLDFQGAGG